MEVQVDRGIGTFVYLSTDTLLNYIDTEPFPTPAAKWKYRAIYTKEP